MPSLLGLWRCKRYIRSGDQSNGNGWCISASQQRGSKLHRLLPTSVHRGMRDDGIIQSVSLAAPLFFLYIHFCVAMKKRIWLGPDLCNREMSKSRRGTPQQSLCKTWWINTRQSIYCRNQEHRGRSKQFLSLFFPTWLCTIHRTCRKGEEKR